MLRNRLFCDRSAISCVQYFRALLCVIFVLGQIVSPVVLSTCIRACDGVVQYGHSGKINLYPPSGWCRADDFISSTATRAHWTTLVQSRPCHVPPTSRRNVPCRTSYPTRSPHSLSPRRSFLYHMCIWSISGTGILSFPAVPRRRCPLLVPDLDRATLWRISFVSRVRHADGTFHRGIQSLPVQLQYPPPTLFQRPSLSSVSAHNSYSDNVIRRSERGLAVHPQPQSR